MFIDNAQSFDTLKVEWEAWSPLVTPDGVIALHDSRESEQGSVRYAREVVLADPRYQVVDTVDSLTVLKRCQPS